MGRFSAGGCVGTQEGARLTSGRDIDDVNEVNVSGDDGDEED